MTGEMLLDSREKVEGVLLVQFDDVRCIAFGEAAIVTYSERIVSSDRVRIARREYVLEIGWHELTLQRHGEECYTVRRQYLEVDDEIRRVTGVRLGGRLADHPILRARMVVIG